MYFFYSPFIKLIYLNYLTNAVLINEKIKLQAILNRHLNQIKKSNSIGF